MRVLLVQPPDSKSPIGLHTFMRLEPLGLEVVASDLIARGHEVEIVDLRFDGPDGLRKAVGGFDPNLCGISCNFASETDRALEIARSLRDMCPGAHIVVGGSHATALPNVFLQSSAVDSLVLGPGEEVVAELADALTARVDLAHVERVLTRAVSARELYQRLGDARLPSSLLLRPDRASTRRYRVAPPGYHYAGRPACLVETARGCKHACSFCVQHLVYRGRHEMCVSRAAKAVAEAWRATGPRRDDDCGGIIFIADDVFAENSERDASIGEELAKAGECKGASVLFQTRVDAVTRGRGFADVVKAWQGVGDGRIKVFVGCESVDSYWLSRWGKGYSACEVRKAVDVLGACPSNRE